MKKKSNKKVIEPTPVMKLIIMVGKQIIDYHLKINEIKSETALQKENYAKKMKK